MKISIHQPETLPWLGFFHKAALVDKFVLLNNVQFRKNYFQNRNKIRTSEGWQWITIPVRHALDTRINEVIISDDPRWKKKCCDSICFSYRKARYFIRYAEEIFSALDSNMHRLSELNIDLIKRLCKFLGIRTQILCASDLGTSQEGSSLILQICKKLNADIYLSGVSGREYLRMQDFSGAGIKVEFQEFHHPVYKQLHDPFIPCMSVIDLLFNHGSQSLDIIKGKGVPLMEKVFV